MLLDCGQVQSLGGGPAQRLSFGGPKLSDGSWIGERQLWLDDRIAFRLSDGCDTCQFLFERDVGANEKLSLVGLANRLTAGLRRLDQGVVERFGELVPRGRYLPLLLVIEPRLTYPGQPGDYFVEEQVDT